MYIYHALSAHMIHINLNMILYTYVEHRPVKNYLHKVSCGKQTRARAHTQTHTHARTHARTRARG